MYVLITIFDTFTAVPV